jgi:thiol:disulfide interchange protein
MKKVIIFCLLLLMVQVSNAQIRFFQGSWAEALAEAKKQNKMIMVDFYTTWCPPCKLMTKTTFADTKVGDFANQNFIAFKVDCERGEGIKLAEKYDIDSYPTICFIDKNGNLRNKEIGYKDVKEFLGILQNYKSQ